MTRGMFVTVLGRFSQISTANYAGKSFNDVSVSSYYAPYVRWASENGLVNGASATSFNPNGNISREDIAVILYRYVERTANDTSLSNTPFASFSDNYAVSSYAVNAMKWATAKDLISGARGYLQPKNLASRAQVAQIFYRAESILPNRTVTPPSGDLALTQEVFRLVNEARAAQGISALTWDDRLKEGCEIRAQEISQVFSHTRPDGSSCFTVSPILNGENIAFGQKTAREVFNAWMGSAGHRENILRTSFKGLYVSLYNKNGVYYWVQLFTYSD